MRNRFVGFSMIALMALVTQSSMTFAQSVFNPRDLTGYWDLTNVGRPAGALNRLESEALSRPPIPVSVIAGNI